MERHCPACTHFGSKNMETDGDQRRQQKSGADLIRAYQLQLEAAMTATFNSNDAVFRHPTPDDAIAQVNNLLSSLLRSHQPRLVDKSPTRSQPSDSHDHRSAGECSSRSARTNEETSSSRVYFKGLVSEETVDRVRKALSRAAFAVCYGNEAVVLALSNCLMTNENEPARNYEVDDLKGLIAGLDHALGLGLKKVLFLSNSNMIFEHITGRQCPGEGHVATLVEQLSLLWRRFTVGYAHVVEKDYSHIAVYTRDMVEKCAICLEDTCVCRMFSIDGCQHRFCFPCMNKHGEAQLLQGLLLPKCPQEGCESELKMDSCEKLLSRELFELMSQRLKEASIPPAEKIYCPYPRCSALMSKTEIRYTSSGSPEDDSGVRKCMRCDELFCIYCKVPWHNSMSCSDYKRSFPHPSPADAELVSLATRNLWRQCPKCSHMVSLDHGCYHIHCRCGHEFCYTCGAHWINEQATCKCPLWDEQNIIYG